MIIYPDSFWQNYYLDLSAKLVRSDSQSKLGICFGLTDVENYYVLLLNPDNGNGYVTRKSKSRDEILAEFRFEWKNKEFNDISLKCQTNKLTVMINDSKPIELSITDPVVGGIGLTLIGNIQTGFDNIHIRKIN